MNQSKLFSTIKNFVALHSSTQFCNFSIGTLLSRASFPKVAAEKYFCLGIFHTDQVFLLVVGIVYRYWLLATNANSTRDNEAHLHDVSLLLKGEATGTLQGLGIKCNKS